MALDRLRSLYEQYFMGIEKIEPAVPRKDVERSIHVLRKEQIRNTALRFRFQMVLQRYNTYQTHWQRSAARSRTARTSGTWSARSGASGATRRAPASGPRRAPPPPIAASRAGRRASQRTSTSQLARARSGLRSPPRRFDIDVPTRRRPSLRRAGRPVGRTARRPSARQAFPAAPGVPPLPSPQRPLPSAPPTNAGRVPRAARLGTKAARSRRRAPAPAAILQPPAAGPPPPVRAAPPPARRLPAWPLSPSPPRPPHRELPEARMRQIYAEYVDAKRRQNESTAAITYQSVAKSLRESGEKLRAEARKAGRLRGRRQGRQDHPPPHPQVTAPGARGGFTGREGDKERKEPRGSSPSSFSLSVSLGR